MTAMRRLLHPGVTLALLAAAGPLCAATLRPQTTLAGQDVRLSDLFSDAGPQADRVLGSAPAPGNQLVIEAAQLAAIARQFSVDWRPASGAEHVVLERPGRPLPREDALAALRAALPGIGARTDCDIELPAYAAPMIPTNPHIQVDAEQLDYDPVSGRFTALLVVTADHMAPIHSRVAGRAQDMVELPVPTRRILPGDLLAAADLHVARVRSALVHSEVAQSLADAAGLQARHPLAPGQPIALSDLQRPAAVRRNATVVITLAGPGMALSATGQALDSGPVGGHIRVLNPTSRAVIEADITGPDQVTVAIGGRASAAASQLASR